MINKIKESSQFIKNEFPSEIHSAIILGSGMGGFEKTFTPLKSFNYSEIPNFIKPSVAVSYTHLTLPTKRIV